MASKPYNILYLSSFGSLMGGGQQSLFYLVSNLDKALFCPHVILPSEDNMADKLRSYDIKVTILELPKVVNLKIIRNFSVLYKLFKLCSAYNIDVINTDGPRNTFYAGLVANMKRIPLVWHIRASNPDRYDRFLYYLSSKIILVANALRQRFSWINKPDKFVTIYNGIDLKEFQPKKYANFLRQQYGISDNSLLISVTGRIEWLKGQKYLIEACGEVNNRLKDFYVLLVGDIVESHYMKECIEKAKELEIQDRIIFAGYKTNISDILNQTDIFVLPSLFEAFPRSVIEAMGLGKPVIVTDVGGCAEAVEDRVSGFVVPVKDVKCLADRILMLGLDKNLRLKIGNAARMRAEEVFSIEKNVRETESIYKEVLGEDVMQM